MHITGREVQLWRNTHWEVMKMDWETPLSPEIAAEIERIFDLLEAQFRRQRDRK